jgi:predicted membrane channel-forming protein YqfA (hemolysin III family)
MRIFFIHRINTAGCGTIIAFFLVIGIVGAVLKSFFETIFSNIWTILVSVLGIILIISFPTILDAIDKRKENKKLKEEKDIFSV